MTIDEKLRLQEIAEMLNFNCNQTDNALYVLKKSQEVHIELLRLIEGIKEGK